MTLKNTIPQDGYNLFSRKESGRNQEICEIGKESITSTSEEGEDEDENEFLNYMASKFDQGKLRKFRRNYRHQIGSNKLSPTQVGTNKDTLRKKVETKDMYKIHGKIGMTGESIRIHGTEEQRRDTRITHGKTNNRGHTEITR